MEYRKYGDTLLVRIDRGEEIVAAVRTVAEAEQISLASVTAIGATDDFTVGVYDVEKQSYTPNTFHGAYEIVSLTGTIDRMEGAVYTHLHMSAGGARGEVFGGHLNRATVSATCEMVIRRMDGAVDRRRDPETGLNLFRFPEDSTRS